MDDQKQQKESHIIVIPERILRNKEYRPADKLVYARIALFEEFGESAEETAEYLGLNPYTVRESKRRLEACGEIIAIENNGRGKRYIACQKIGEILAGLGRELTDDDRKKLKKLKDICEARLKKARTKSVLHENQHIDKNETRKSKEDKSKFKKPTVLEIKAYVEEKGYSIDPEAFYDYNEARGWMVGKNRMKDWKAAVRTWNRHQKNWANENIAEKNKPAEENHMAGFVKKVMDISSISRGDGSRVINPTPPVPPNPPSS